MSEETKAKPRRRYARVPKASNSATTPADAKEPIKPKTRKIADVINLLQRSEGATLDEIVKATGWLPHSARAALTGLKKKGHVIAKSKRDDVTCYRITKAA